MEPLINFVKVARKTFCYLVDILSGCIVLPFRKQITTQLRRFQFFLENRNNVFIKISDKVMTLIFNPGFACSICCKHVFFIGTCWWSGLHKKENLCVFNQIQKIDTKLLKIFGKSVMKIKILFLKFCFHFRVSIIFSRTC